MIPKAIEIVLVLMICVLAGLLLFAGSPGTPDCTLNCITGVPAETTEITAGSSPSADNASVRYEAFHADPLKTAGLFGWTPPPVHPIPSQPVMSPLEPEPPPPVNADWLHFIGRMNSGSGIVLFFRSSRSGRIEKAGPGGTWTVTGFKGSEVLLEKDGERIKAEVN